MDQESGVGHSGVNVCHGNVRHTSMMFPWTRKKLLAQLTSGDPWQKSQAVNKLAQCRRPDVVAALVSVLNDVRPARLAAARVLTGMGWTPSSKEQEAIIAIAHNRWNDVKALGSDALNPLIQELQGAFSDGALNVVAAMGDVKAVPILVNYLGIENDHSAKTVVDGLLKIGSPALSAVQEALRASAPRVRERAAVVLGQLGDLKAVEPLMSLLADVSINNSVRGAAVEALGKLKDPRPVKQIAGAIEALGGYHWKAFEALTRIGDSAAAQALADMLGTGWGSSAVGALEKIGPPAIPALVSALKQPKVGRDVAKALDRLGWKAETVGESVSYFLALEDSHGLAKLSREAVPDLAPIALDATRDRKVRRTAIHALSRIGGQAARDALLELALNDKSVRGSALLGLGAFPEPLVVETILRILTSEEDPELVEWGIRSLGEIGDPTAIPYLQRALHDSNQQVRRWAAISLGDVGGKDSAKFGHSIGTSLGPLLKDSNRDIREAAARGLGRLGGSTAATLLFSAIPALGVDAAAPLAQMGDERAVEPLKTRLTNAFHTSENPEYSLRHSIFRGLEKLGKMHVVLDLILSHVNEEQFGEELSKEITRVIEQEAATIDEAQLTKILALTNVVQVQFQDDGCGNSKRSGTRAIDCSQIRQLARQELIRRGKRV